MSNLHTRRQVELVWEEFWRVGVYDSVEILEQILYLLFLRRLDQQRPESNGAACLRLRADCGPLGADGASLHWSAFRSLPDEEMFALLSDHVYPRLRVIGGPGAAYARHLKDVHLSIPTPGALGNIVRLLDELPGPRRHGGADPFEYVADKLARLGQRGDFYTPRHLERQMVALVAPVPEDIICCPASGSGNFMVATARHLAQRYPALLANPAACEHFHHRMFHAYDADKTMLRLSCMRMLLQGVRNPNIQYTNSIAPTIGDDEGRYSVILSQPSTATLPEGEEPAERVRAVGLMVAQFVRMLRRGGRAAVIVPAHILTGHSAAERSLRRMLVYEQRLDAVIPLPGASFSTNSGQRKVLLLFTRTERKARLVPYCTVGHWGLGQWAPIERRAGPQATYSVPRVRMAGETRCDRCDGSR